jgi:hydroxymethylpyrimidine kinase/phosphomethylpyrimidine kinase
MPTVLTIAGSDPTGGAGVQADLQVFASLACHGAGVITSLTVQDTRGVQAVHHVTREIVRDQLARLLADVAVGAAKTGMLAEAGIVEVVGEALRAHPGMPLVVDPVVTSTSGRRLLDEAGVGLLRRDLLPRATLVTPNLAEAEVLTGHAVRSVPQMRDAARRLVDLGAGAALVKGGHLPGEPVDVLCLAGELHELTGPRVPVPQAVHGTGCALSAAATAFLAQGDPLPLAVQRAKAYVAAGLAAARTIGGGSAVLDYVAAARGGV